MFYGKKVVKNGLLLLTVRKLISNKATRLFRTVSSPIPEKYYTSNIAI